MRIILTQFSILVVIVLSIRCKKSEEYTLFKLLPSSKTGIDFSNTVKESDTFNILTFEYIYNGAGVGICDFNNDGLKDIFFCGNQVSNKLYLNRGDFNFDDVSTESGIADAKRWSSGVSTVDINNDGRMDIYVCATAMPDSAGRKNLLYINQGWDDNGVPSFKEMAESYKVAYGGYSVMAAFFDYDHDGDLDLYILTNVKTNDRSANFFEKIVDGSAANNDKLFRNNGNETFSDVTLQSGILEEGFGLGLSIADFNNDSWPDIYVSNDFMTNDILYINNKNGTFRNATSEYTGHQSQFSMGNDAADFNNDGLMDIVTLDMLPENNHRKKTTIGNKSYQSYQNTEHYRYQYQFMRNMLQLNNGVNEGIRFSEIGQMAGIYQTDWSWSPLLADFDNDGWKDLLITNGYPKDITDKDFANYRVDTYNTSSRESLLKLIPTVKISSYAFRNNGDLTFSDVSKLWGIDMPSFSNGAAFADLDNDGDLDYVVSKINDPAAVYENTVNSHDQPVKQNYLQVQLIGSTDNVQATGAKVTLFYNDGKIQFSELEPYRGFLSSVDQTLHFGLGSSLKIDSLIVEWPNGETSQVNSLKANQNVKISYRDKALKRTPLVIHQKKLGLTSTHVAGLNIKDEEEDQIDFNIQRTLPHKFSQAGPGVAVGDLNGDTLEDIVIGGSMQKATTILLQRSDGSFASGKSFQQPYKIEEDEGLLLFDADNDGDLDLYIVSGGMKEYASPDIFQDNYYVNDGKGNFTKSNLPDTRASGSCVRAADFDADGDLDLFVGGRVVQNSYPYPARSYVLQNNSGVFTDITDQVAPTLSEIGMVTDALWTDYNNDGKVDLMLVGEFMAATFFKNENSKLIQEQNTTIQNQIGWWNSIVAGDFDRDNDMDYLVGNLGANNNFQIKEGYPLKVLAKDFDHNGSIDPIMSCYSKTSETDPQIKLFPMHFWDEINSQSPMFRAKFGLYSQYATVSTDRLFSPDEIKDALQLEANNMKSSYVENLGGGKFKLKSLTPEVQIAPVNGMVTGDYNSDTFLDVLMVGNDFGNEVFSGRYDAFTGALLLGDGKGNFKYQSSAKSGFYVPGDAKGLVQLKYKGEPLVIATQNRDSLKVFYTSTTFKNKMINPEPYDFSMNLLFENGQKQKVEFYYGSSYLSQSTRSVLVPQGVSGIMIQDFSGNLRTVDIEKLSAR